jgi:hypothetical protein
VSRRGGYAAKSSQTARVFGRERHLEYIIKEYVEHYHTERSHQGIGNEIIEPPPQGQREIICRDRFGGLLNFYGRAA